MTEVLALFLWLTGQSADVNANAVPQPDDQSVLYGGGIPTTPPPSNQ